MLEPLASLTALTTFLSLGTRSVSRVATDVHTARVSPNYTVARFSIVWNTP